MSTIKTVAVIGGSGNLGPSIINALLSANFTVTALTRESSTSTFPASVRVHKVDYSSAASLASAFAGQDAVVCAIATAALTQQQKIVDAAVQAGVKRFIPSEFGIDTEDLTEGTAKILATKVQLQAYLRKNAEENPAFSWTGISTGLFFDWGLQAGSLAINIPSKTITIYDSGNERFQATNLPTIGAAIASILQHAAETANTYLRIASFTTSQNELLSILQEESGVQWTVKKLSTDESRKTGDEKLAKGDRSAFGDYLKEYLFKDGQGHAGGKLANTLLGLPQDDLRKTIKAAL